MAVKSKQTIVGIPWSLSSIWNERLDDQPERPLLPRNYIYASELGKSFCDRYLAMNAVPYSNPPNKRSKRKFVAGDAWEWIVGLVLMSSNMLQNKQVKVDTQIKGLLSVHGRLDFIAGGKFDYDNAMKQLEVVNSTLSLLNMSVPPFFLSAAEKFIHRYKGKILEEVIYECKTVSSFMMEKIQKTNSPMIHHKLQNYHYTKGNDVGILTGKVGYVCKDDCIMEEFIVADDKDTKKLYVADIKKMTDYYNAGFDKKNPLRYMPPKEDLIVFEEGVWRFSKNWKVEYSNYLQLIYGYETPEKYRNAWQYKATSWSRVFKRSVLEGAEIKRPGKDPLIMRLTPDNKQKIKEAKELFPNWDKLVAKAKAAGAFVNQEETEEEDD
jgi:hypothetical protein